MYSNNVTLFSLSLVISSMIFPRFVCLQDFRAMILAGLTPEVIVDIASRGLAFYSFQVNFELVRTSTSVSGPPIFAPHIIVPDCYHALD